MGWNSLAMDFLWDLNQKSLKENALVNHFQITKLNRRVASRLIILLFVDGPTVRSCVNGPIVSGLVIWLQPRTRAVSCALK